MTELQTNPNAVATLMLRFETEFGPRTVIVGNLTARDASAIAQVANASDGITAAYTEERARQSLVAMLAKRKKAAAKLKVVSRPENVVPMQRGKNGN